MPAGTGATWAIVRRMTSLGGVVLAQEDAAGLTSAVCGEPSSVSTAGTSRHPMALVGLAGGWHDRRDEWIGRLDCWRAAKALSDTSGSYRGLAGSLIIERTTAAVLRSAGRRDLRGDVGGRAKDDAGTGDRRGAERQLSDFSVKSWCQSTSKASCYGSPGNLQKWSSIFAWHCFAASWYAFCFAEEQR